LPARWRVRLLLSTVLAALIVPITQSPAQAAPILSLNMISWGVIGLDSNDVDAGPNTFAEGARLCNTGTSSADDLTGTFVWDSANAYVSIYGLSSLSVSSLAAGACTDLYYTVQIQRTSSAYDTTREFHIQVSGPSIATVSTPTPREVYVEKLVSQNRNTVNSVTGPTNVLVGSTYSYTFTSDTAPGGYEQMSTYLDWPNSIFQIESVSATYTAPAGGTNDTIYADACGWQPDPTSVDYRSCVGPDGYSGGKAGGSMSTTYTIKVIAPGTANMGGLVYDFSGSSYHYNSDWSGTFYAVTATESADVSITKSDSPNSLDAGQNVTYTLHVANAGPGTADAVTVTDPVPAGTNFVSADSGGSNSSGTVTWNLGDLAPGASTDLQVVLHVVAGRLTDVSNTASVSTSSTDPAAGNDSATEGTTVTTSADMSVTKSDSPDPVQEGQPLTYTLDVANAGPSDAQNVVVTDPLPAGVSYVSATPSQGSCSQAAGVVTCSLGTVGVGATPTIAIDVTAGSAGTISNTASVSSDTSDPSSGDNSDTEGTTVQPTADLSVSKGDSPDPVVAGNQVTYTMVVTNNGPSTAQSVVLADPLPAGTSFVSADGGGSESGGTVTWNLGDLANGASATVHLTVAVNAGRTSGISNTATVSSDTLDAISGNDSATAGTGVDILADLSIVKSDSSDPVAVGDAFTYTLDVANAGPSHATNVVVSDPLPAEVSYVSATPSQGSCSEAGGTVTCSLGALADGGTASIDVLVTADVDGPISNAASVSSDVADPASANDSDAEDTTVQPRADLSITKSDSIDPVDSGNDLTYTLDVANAGPSDATGVVIADPVPGGTSFVSATPTQGSCVEGAGTVTCSLGALANGGTASVDVVVHVSASRTTPLSNTASVTSDITDPVAANDSDTEGTGVNVSADLAISKSDSDDPAAAGNDLTYTLDVVNSGPSDATGVVVTDPLPAGTSFVSADNGGSEAGGVVTWNVGPLPNGGSTALHMTVHVDPSRVAPLSNTASVSSGSTDPDSSNDSATEATSIAAVGDLAVDVDDVAASVVAGGSTTYSMTLTNQGPSTAPAGAVVSAAIPAGTVGSESEADCTISAGVLDCTTSGALAPGDSVTWQVTLDIDSGYAGATLDETATITAFSVADSDGSNDASTDTDAVTRSADLGVGKSDGVDPVVAGNQLTYSIVVADNGPSDASGVVVTDDVPAGTTFVSADNGGTESGGTVTWNIGGLTDGSAVTVHVTVSVDPGRTADLSNTASATSAVSDPDGSNDSATEATGVNTQADASVTQSDSPDPIPAGQDVTYSLNIQNAGPSDAQAVVVTDTLPAGVVFVSATPSQGSCLEAAGVVTCSLGSVGAGSNATIDVVVTTSVSGTITNGASVTTTTADTDASNDSSSEDTTVNVPSAGTADLELRKTVKDAKPERGSDATYVIRVSNHGPNDATNVVVTDALPDGLEFVSADPSQGAYDESSGDWTVGDLAADGSASMTLVATVVGKADQITNVAIVKGLDQSDPASGNDSSTVAVDVLGSGGARQGGGRKGGGGGNGTGGSNSGSGDPTAASETHSLAFTGRDIAATAAGGALLLGLGVLLLLLGRRRRDQDGRPNAVGF
jgi:uncharacterized repeat protein (TIGR01451 family)